MSDPHRPEDQDGFPRLAQDPAPERPPGEGEDWAAMFFHAPIAAFVVDGDGTIIAANVAALVLTGVSDLVGRSFASLLGGPTARETVTLVISGEAGSRVAAILATARADLAVELSGTRLPGPGRFRHLVQAVAVAERRDSLERLAALAHRDELTGLLNRRGFLVASDALLRTAQEHGKQLTVLFVDIDGLKMVNDRFGHSTGDRVITAVAAALRDSFRDRDAVGRIGGDEFCVTALSRDAQSTVQLRRRLLDAVATVAAHWPDTAIQVSITVGAAHCSRPLPGVLPELLDSADRAMYAQRQARPAR